MVNHTPTNEAHQKMQRIDIPDELIKLAAEATSNHNDGFVKQGYIMQLKVWRDYIDRILKSIEDSNQDTYRMG